MTALTYRKEIRTRWQLWAALHDAEVENAALKDANTSLSHNAQYLAFLKMRVRAENAEAERDHLASMNESKNTTIDALKAEFAEQEKELARQFHRAENAEAELEQMKELPPETCPMCGDVLHSGPCREFNPEDQEDWDALPKAVCERYENAEAENAALKAEIADAIARAEDAEHDRDANDHQKARVVKLEHHHATKHELCEFKEAP